MGWGDKGEGRRLGEGVAISRGGERYKTCFQYWLNTILPPATRRPSGCPDCNHRVGPWEVSWVKWRWGEGVGLGVSLSETLGYILGHDLFEHWGGVLWLLLIQARRPTFSRVQPRVVSHPPNPSPVRYLHSSPWGRNNLIFKYKLHTSKTMRLSCKIWEVNEPLFGRLIEKPERPDRKECHVGIHTFKCQRNTTPYCTDQYQSTGRQLVAWSFIYWECDFTITDGAKRTTSISSKYNGILW